MTEQVKPNQSILKGTRLLQFNFESKRRFLIHQGGSRSGKTWSIIQYLILTALQCENQVFTICRKTLPALRATAMRDFLEQLQIMNLYSERFHNKSDNTYKLNNNLFEFISVDEPAKIRGRKRNFLFVNECNELTIEDFRQLEMRTTDKIILDYNPSEADSFVYDIMIQKPDEVDFLISTFQDNPFLEDSIKRTIQAYKDTDINFWEVFGLGQRGIPQELIYTNWKSFETHPQYDDTCYGLDVGFNHPSSLVQIGFRDGELYWTSLIHESYLTTADLIAKMKDVSKNVPMYVDSARPDVIEDLRRAGYDAKSAQKDVKPGIDFCKRHRIFVHKDSTEAIKEMKSYRWKKKGDGKILDEPTKIKDDFCDAARYGSFTHNRSPKGTIDFAFFSLDS